MLIIKYRDCKKKPKKILFNVNVKDRLGLQFKWTLNAILENSNKCKTQQWCWQTHWTKQTCAFNSMIFNQKRSSSPYYPPATMNKTKDNQ